MFWMTIQIEKSLHRHRRRTAPTTTQHMDMKLYTHERSHSSKHPCSLVLTSFMRHFSEFFAHSLPLRPCLPTYCLVGVPRTYHSLGDSLFLQLHMEIARGTGNSRPHRTDSLLKLHDISKCTAWAPSEDWPWPSVQDEAHTTIQSRANSGHRRPPVAMLQHPHTRTLSQSEAQMTGKNTWRAALHSAASHAPFGVTEALPAWSALQCPLSSPLGAHGAQRK